MNIRIINSKLFSKLANKKYRNLFVASQINKGIPFQMRALRAARKMKQSDLAILAGTTQTVISRIENNGAGNLSVKTLLKLAEAFDVALVVRFEPIDNLIDWVDNLSQENLSPSSSEEILKSLSKQRVRSHLSSSVTTAQAIAPNRRKVKKVSVFDYGTEIFGSGPQLQLTGNPEGQIHKGQLNGIVVISMRSSDQVAQ